MFYWLEAILTLIEAGESTISFSDLVDQMIASVWFTVSTYRLKLGAIGKSLEKKVRAKIFLKRW